MNIHEYQAKDLLRYGVAVPRGALPPTPEEADEVANELGGPVWVVKAQIHAGGRGKAVSRTIPKGKGGVRVVKSVADVAADAGEMLGNTLVTLQTGPAGKKVKRLYIEEGCDIEREFYLGLLLDRATSRVTFMASTEGGMEIEEVAAQHPEKILKVAVDPAPASAASRPASSPSALGLEGNQVNSCGQVRHDGLYKAFVRTRRVARRDQPAGRHQGAARSSRSTPRSTSTTTPCSATRTSPRCATQTRKKPPSVEAAKHELNYVKLDGNIGCLVNGAGLAMATMDIIKLHGGEPANFLDVGGGAKERAGDEAFKLILSDQNVKASWSTSSAASCAAT